ncbi:MAG: hypothetical protein H7X97_06415 [Opitutaceae bacterium]|nr:hypothetical protein [Verrucomicrobiales bacterium]
MKTENSVLDRLLKGAAQTRPTIPAEPPFGFETRVLAHLKSLSPADDLAFLLPILRRGLLAAGMILLISVVASYSTLDRADDDELVLVNSTLELVMK